MIRAHISHRNQFFGDLRILSVITCPGSGRRYFEIGLEGRAAFRLKRYSQYLGDVDPSYIVSECLERLCRTDIDYVRWKALHYRETAQ